MTNFELLFKLKETLINTKQNDKIANWILVNVYNLKDNLDLVNILPLESTKTKECFKILNEYLLGKPLARIFGTTNFCCNNFIVDEGVFCPRNETELLVDNLLKYIKKMKFLSRIKILDMCCGTGVIGISTKLNYIDDIDLTLVDINEKACINSQKNLDFHKVQANVINSDLFNKLINKFDVIVCNPPYIAFEEDIGLVRKYDPSNSLFANNNGYFIYEEVINNYLNYISNSQKYLLAFEIGKDQEETIKNMLLDKDSKINVDIIKDYNNINRFIFAYKNYDI